MEESDNCGLSRLSDSAVSLTALTLSLIELTNSSLEKA